MTVQGDGAGEGESLPSPSHFTNARNSTCGHVHMPTIVKFTLDKNQQFRYNV